MKLPVLSIIVTLLLISQVSYSQEKAPNHFSLGFNINQIQNDFGLGSHFVSPYFANENLAVRFGGNVAWLQHIDTATSEYTWSTYGNAQVGFRGRHFIIEDKIFIYGEGGILLLFPSKTISSESVAVGGYGLFGTELKAGPRFSFFTELGGAGTGARADVLPGKPIYSNGFMACVGLRVGL